MILCSLAAIAIACGALSAGHQDAFQPVRIVEDSVSYPIRGDNIRQIRKQLRNHGPWTAGRGHGRTRSVFDVRTELEPGEHGCRLAGFEVTLTITVTLPEWQPGPRAPAALHAQWASALDRLVQHEQGHRQHAVDAAHELRQSLSRLPAQETCSRTQRMADDLLRKAVARLRLRGMIYDGQTDNGLAEPTTTP